MSSKGGSRFEKTFSRKKKATAAATAAATATTTANGGEKKSNNEKKGSEEKQVTKKQPSSQNQKQTQETPPSSSKTVIKIKFNPPKPTNNPQKSNQQASSSSSAKSKSKPEKVENLNKEKKRKAENQNVGRGKEEKKVKAAAAAKNGKKKEKEKEKDEEEGLECVFPTARIARIVKSEGSDYKLSSEAIFLINKATEKFIEQFSEDAYGYAVEDRKSFVAYKHLAAAVSKGKSFDFLSDFVPEKVTAEKALAERKPPETIPG